MEVTSNKESRSGQVGSSINTCGGRRCGFSPLPRTNAGLTVKLCVFPDITKRRSERDLN